MNIEIKKIKVKHLDVLKKSKIQITCILSDDCKLTEFLQYINDYKLKTQKNEPSK